MLDTFKAQLKAKTKAAGVNLSQTRIDAIADRLHKKNPDLTEVADHDARIDDLNELTPFSDIAKQDDRLRTLEAKQKPPTKDTNDTEEESDPANPTKNKKPTDEPPAWAKDLITTVNALKSEKVQTTMKQRVAEKLKDVVPEAFYKGRVIPEKEEDLEAFLEEVKTDYTAFNQDLVNKGLMTATPPPNGEGSKANDKAFEAAMDSFVEDKKGATTSTKK